MARYDAGELESFVAAVLTGAGSDQAEARVVASNLVGANLRGVDSHGVIRLGVYARRVKQGQITTPARPSVLRRTAATALLDGGNGWGAVVGTAAMRLAIEMARESGSGTVAVLNSNHFGYCAYYGEMALAEDMIGVVVTNANALMIPTGGRVPALGTNPICICAPAGEEAPFVFDAATTVVARGKINVAAKQGKRIPLDWGVDADGNPTDDAAAVAYLSPLGGYKGYDLALAVDILSGVLPGGPFGPHIGVLGGASGPQQVGHFLMALRIDAFREAAEFKADMDRMLRELRSQPAAAGTPGVLIAGDPERAALADRTAQGIPVSPEIETDLASLAAELGLRLPAPKQ